MKDELPEWARKYFYGEGTEIEDETFYAGLCFLGIILIGYFALILLT